MCGIAGFSIASNEQIDKTTLGRLLLTGLSERGEDSSGYAFRQGDEKIALHKVQMPVYELLPQVQIPNITQEAIFHVRDYTKGTPGIHWNNHPIQHGQVIGVHNGRIQNDEELFREMQVARAHPEMTVDSEAIFMMLANLTPNEVWPRLIGSYSCAWFDERKPELVHFVRGHGRPLHIAYAPGILIFSSTRHSLNYVAREMNLPLKIKMVPIGVHLAAHNGQIVVREHFKHHPYTEDEAYRYDRNENGARAARRVMAELLNPNYVEPRMSVSRDLDAIA